MPTSCKYGVLEELFLVLGYHSVSDGIPLPNTSFHVLGFSDGSDDICRLGRANGESKDNIALKPRGVHWPGARHIDASPHRRSAWCSTPIPFLNFPSCPSISSFPLNNFPSFSMSSSSSSSYRGRGGARCPQGRGNRGSSRGGRGGRGGPNGRGRGGTPTVDRAGVPGGICAFYWSTGSCDRSFECIFKHEVKSSALGTFAVSATETEDQSPDFFSREGLAMNNGSVVDSQHTLRPNEAHNHLRLYLANNFVFRDANNVESFSRIFASVNSRNKAWVRMTLIRIHDFKFSLTHHRTLIRLRLVDLLRHIKCPISFTLG